MFKLAADGIPVLPAYRDGVRLLVYCQFEQTWHYHGAVAAELGAGNGHRTAHCTTDTDFKATGYYLVEQDDVTPPLKKMRDWEGYPPAWAKQPNPYSHLVR